MEKLIENRGLRLRLQENDSQITITWEGRSTDRDPSLFLVPVFNEILESKKNLLMDFKKLEYMNSSTITPLIKVLDRLRNTEQGIQIVYNRNLKWQELSFSALEIFKTNDNRIQISGE